MQFLIGKYGSHNVADYPLPIQQLIEIHRIQCLRRHYKLRDTKIIFAFPMQDSLAEYANKISPAHVHSFYDHVITLQGQGSATIPSQPLTIVNPEEYVVQLSADRTKTLAAPKGIRLEVTEALKEVAGKCIKSWFHIEEVYLLT